MKKELDNYLRNVGYTGHTHNSITERLNCSTCKGKFEKIIKERARLKQLHPEEFARREPEYKPSERTVKHADMLGDRIKHDKEYQKVLRRMPTGIYMPKK